MDKKELAGAAIVVGGVLTLLDAAFKDDDADQIVERAQKKYNSEKEKLERIQKDTEKSLRSLGKKKETILFNSMKKFVNNYSYIKDIELRNSKGINELSKFYIDDGGVVEIIKMRNIYENAIEDAVEGAAVGAVTALAVGGGISALSGSIGAMGAAVTMGEVGSLSLAGSGIALGLGAVIPPALLFTAISADKKAEENLEKAKAYEAEMNSIIEKMKTSHTKCKSIKKRTELLEELLNKLDTLFSECVGKMSQIIELKKKESDNDKISTEDFNENELKLLAITRSLAGAIKTVIDTPMLSSDGELTDEASKTYEVVDSNISNWKSEIKEQKEIEMQIEIEKQREIEEQIEIEKKIEILKQRKIEKQNEIFKYRERLKQREIEKQKEEELRQIAMKAGISLGVGSMFLKDMELLNQIELPEKTELLNQIELPEKTELLNQIELPEETELLNQIELPEKIELPTESRECEVSSNDISKRKGIISRHISLTTVVIVAIMIFSLSRAQFENTKLAIKLIGFSSILIGGVANSRKTILSSIFEGVLSLILVIGFTILLDNNLLILPKISNLYLKSGLLFLFWFIVYEVTSEKSDAFCNVLNKVALCYYAQKIFMIICGILFFKIGIRTIVAFETVPIIYFIITIVCVCRDIEFK